MKAKGVVDRATAHKAQENPKQKEDVAALFLSSTLALLEQLNRSQAFVVNMYQTLHNPKDYKKRTLAKRGSRTVHSKSVKTSIGHVSAPLAVCADGTKLPLFLSA